VNIVIDTREKNPWEFFTEKTTKKTLKCGDYTTSLLMSKFAIERKASTGEVYMNLGRTKNMERFHREVDKLLLLEEAECVFEFSESDIYCFPENSGIPRFRRPSVKEIANGKYLAGEKVDAWSELRINGRHLKTLIDRVAIRMPVVFCGTRREAENYVLGRFKELEKRC
jgi:hypothetical protein